MSFQIGYFPDPNSFDSALGFQNFSVSNCGQIILPSWVVVSIKQ